ncbi:MAG TPA: PfkB family carbohydrate kinase [Candidatus Acidoferrales bacterium]|nr:PfkB family carbohydrate kinase [Candidatus Acidoferrales bacterium]
MLDEFVSGDISRVSREAPVLILRHRRTDAYPGGSANAAMNLASLGANVLAVGVVGNDAGGEALLDCFRAAKINAKGVFRVKGWTTPVKTRYLAGWTHTTEQQVLRVDREPSCAIPYEAIKTLERNARRAAAAVDAVLVSDYGFGAATPGLVQKLNVKRIMLDSRYRLLEYRGCRITAATPNEYELQAAFHTEIGSNVAKLEQIGECAREELGLNALVVTRGKDGLAVLEAPEAKAGRSRAAHHIPVYGSDQAVDVTGAGDTVIAVFTLALAAGASYLEAAHLANYAGGIVVMKRRTATVTRAELENALRAEATAQR